MGEHTRVVEPHQPDSTAALIVRQGEHLHFERRKTEWAGWLWCTNNTGQSGWVPESWVEIQGGTAVLCRDYDATELAVKPGDAVQVGFAVSGWAWITRADGATGWIPLNCLDWE